MAGKLPDKLGITLAIDGLKKIGTDLKALGGRVGKAADQAAKPWDDAGKTISQTIREAGDSAAEMSKEVSKAAEKSGDAIEGAGSGAKRFGSMLTNAAGVGGKALRAVGTQAQRMASAVGTGASRAAGALVSVNAAADRMSSAIGSAAARSVRSILTITKAGLRMSTALSRAGFTAGRALGRGIANGARTATGALAKIGTGIAGGLVGTGYAVNETAQGIQQQARLARTSGTTIEKFSALAAVTSQYGMDIEDLSGAMADLSEKIDEAYRDPESSIAALFERAGISVRGANGELRDTADVFADIPDALRRIKSTAERSSVATQLIAGDSEKLASVLALTNDEMRARMRLAARTGQIIDDKQVRLSQKFLDSFYALKATVTGLFKQVSLRLYPAFGQFFTVLRKGLEANGKLISDKFASSIEKTLGLITQFTAGLLGLGESQAAKGLNAFIDLVSAAGKGAAMLISRFSGVGDGIKKGLSSGIIAMRDFAASFMIASGNETEAGQLFGKKITGKTRVKSKIDRNGREVFDEAKEVDSGYALDFEIEDETFSAAKGFSGAIDGMLAKFRELSQYVQIHVVPVFSDVFRALAGDDVAYRKIIHRFQRLIEESDTLQGMLDRLDKLAGQSDVFEFLYHSLLGRPISNDNWVVKHLRDIGEAFAWVEEHIFPKIADLKQKLGELLGTQNPYLIGGALLGGKAALSWVAVGLTAIIAPARALGVAITGIATAARFLFLTPVGLAIGALSLLAVALTDSEKLKSTLGSLVDYVNGALTSAWAAFADTFPDLAAKIEATLRPIGALIDKISGYVGSNSEDLVSPETQAEGRALIEKAQVQTRNRLAQIQAGGPVIDRPDLADGTSWRDMIDTVSQTPAPAYAETYTNPAQPPVAFEVVIGSERIPAQASADAAAALKRNLQTSQRRRIGG